MGVVLCVVNTPFVALFPKPLLSLPPSLPPSLQDPAGIFELIEVVGNGTYGQVHKVRMGLLWHF